MSNGRFAIALSVVNLAILVYLLLPRTGLVQAATVAPVLRARMLEIVDDQGRVRASVQVHAAGVFKPTGTRYPETVVLRLIDAKGRPEVKIAASERGGGLSFVGESDETQVLLRADGSDSSLKLANKDGKHQLIKP